MTTNTRPGRALHERELEVLALVADGLEDKEIAARLRIERKTVQMHLFYIFKVLGCNNRTEAAVWYVRYIEQPLTGRAR